MSIRNLTLACVASLALACTVNASASVSGGNNPDDASSDGNTKPIPDGEADSGDDASGSDAAASGDFAPAEGGEDADGGDPSAGGDVDAPGDASCEDGKYKPGDTWKDDCNTCKCSDAGVSECTRMKCEQPA